MSKLNIEIDFDPAPSTATTIVKIDGEAIGIIQALSLNVAVDTDLPAVSITLPYDSEYEFSKELKQIMFENEAKIRKLSTYVKISYSNSYFKN